MVKMLRFVKLSLLVLIVSLAVSKELCANVTVGPSITEVTVRPGETGKVVFEVNNVSEQDMRIKVEAVDWLVSSLGREGKLDDVYEWLDLEGLEPFVVPARAQAKLTCDLIAPKDFEGEKVAQVFFEYEPVDPTPIQAETLRVLSQRIGVLLCFGAKGTELFKGEFKIREVSSAINEDGTVDVAVKYALGNSGNVHFKPYGRAKIWKKKEVVAEVELENIRGLFAKQVREYQADLVNLPLAEGKYKIELEMDLRSFEMVETLTSSKKFAVRG